MQLHLAGMRPVKAVMVVAAAVASVLLVCADGNPVIGMFGDTEGKIAPHHNTLLALYAADSVCLFKS